MHQHELHTVIPYFKVLADETRLNILAYLSREEWNVGDLAKQLHLSEPTVSHHLAKLRSAGLINLRTDGNQRFYQMNKNFYRSLVKRFADLENVQPAPETNDISWMDQLPPEFDEEARMVLRNHTFNGRITKLPRKELKLLTVLEWVTLGFEPERIYTEKEVNEVIKQYHDDFASIRRDLIDFGFLRRERGGSQYWVTPQDEEI